MGFVDELLNEINNDREEHGKKPFDDDNTPKSSGKKRLRGYLQMQKKSMQ